MATRSQRKRAPRGLQARRSPAGLEDDPSVLKEADLARLEGDPPILKETDLTKLEGDPTELADVDVIRERIWLTGKMPNWLGGSFFELRSEVVAESALGATAVLKRGKPRSWGYRNY